MAQGGWFGFELFVDAWFCVDLALNFRTGFVTDDGATITNPRKVARKYATTWLALDTIVGQTLIGPSKLRCRLHHRCPHALWRQRCLLPCEGL